jgi:Rad3-related DNA helicase
MIQELNWRQFFPYNVVRPEQERAINFILSSFFESKKRVCIAELGTGLGKSAIAITVAKYLSANVLNVEMEGKSFGSYILTTQKILQDQYTNDFGPKKKNLLQSIKSSSNYTCVFHNQQSCGESRRLLSVMSKQLSGTDFSNTCRSRCPYVLQKTAFLNSDLGITNFSYFLAETMYAKKLLPRDLLIIDEAHNIESEVSKFIEVTFSEKFSREVLKCKLPKLRGLDDYTQIVFDWVCTTYKSALARHILAIKKAIEKGLNVGDSGMQDLSKQYEMLDKHICKVNRFITTFNIDNWILNIIEPFGKSQRKFEFKPISIADYAEDVLFRFGDRILLMSATIVDKSVFCKSIGINENDTTFISIPSPFPTESHKIHYMPVGKMSIKNIDVTLPKLTEIISMLLEQHASDKGIIHCNTFKIANYLKENIKSNRLLIHNSDDREKVLNFHISNPQPTVLLSPSMTEGINLSDDSSRFQILCKVPFPYLGDKVIKKRKLNDSRWYPFQTAKSVIQALGRSVRNETDYAVSYILDEDWDYFYRINNKLFSDEFKNSFVV